MSDNYNNLSLIIFVISMGISFCAFIWTLLHSFLQRPRLRFLLDQITYRDNIGFGRKIEIIRILMINYGYRPIIISECKFWINDGVTCHYGIYNALAAPYSVSDIVLPVLIEPAKTVMLNLTHPDNINKITGISVYDSKRKEYKINESTMQNLKLKINKK